MQELIGKAYCSDVFPCSQHTVFLNSGDVQRCGAKVGQQKGPRVKVGHGTVRCVQTHRPDALRPRGRVKESFTMNGSRSLIGKEGQRGKNGHGVFGGR